MLLECVFVTAILLAGFHCIAERIDLRTMPSGDEGSWLSVAAELSRGHGFSTHWLEYQFQKPYALPRPDDFRYPALTLLLAAVFRVTGVSYTAALWTCAGIFLCFCAAVYGTVQKAFGPATALLTLCATALSLNQLQWNSVVYAEGLFGLVLAGVIYLSITLDARKKRWWIGLGGGIGALAMVRPNGILLAAGLMWHFVRMPSNTRVPLRYLLYGLLAVCIVMTPWFIRNALCFGSLFHIAGGAGLLQRTINEPANESFLTLLKTAGVLFPFKATVIGIPRFAKTIIEFEHGLCIPLAGLVAAGFFQGRRFYNSFTFAGFCLTLALCCYAAYKSYAGVRYFTAFIPFVYAYGLYFAVASIRRIGWAKRRGYARYSAYALVCASFIAPIIYPLRYFERLHAAHRKTDQTYSEHRRTLDSLLSRNDCYFAASLSQLNFLFEYNCVGIQEDFDSSGVYRALSTFKPKILAFTSDEIDRRPVRDFIGLCTCNGCRVRQAARTASAVYFLLEYPLTGKINVAPL